MAGRRNRGLPRTPPAKQKPASPLVVLAAVVGVPAGLFAFAFGSRWLATEVTPTLFLWSDGDYRRLVASLLALWALGPLLVLGATHLQKERGRWAAAPVWVLVAGLALLLFGYIPGRNNNGRLGRELSSVAGGSPLADVGDVFIGSAVAALVCFLVVVPTVYSVTVVEDSLRRTPRRRLAIGAVVYVGAWIAAGAIVVAIAGTGVARITWLEDTARVLPGGDAGITGDFQVGLDTSVVDLVDCDTAAQRLRVDGEVPELDGCRRALLVAATGRYEGEDGVRVSSGQLVAVVVQVRTQGQLDDLDAALDAATIEGGGGLPEPTGEMLVSPADAALSLVIADEDTGDIPLPAEGAGLRPMSRALAYVVIGSAVGLYVSPPEETPAP